MSWLHEEKARGEKYAELISLLIYIRQYLSEECEDSEAKELAERLQKYTRNPV